MKNIFLKQKIFLLFGSSLQCNIIDTIEKLSEVIVKEEERGLIIPKTDDDRKKLEKMFVKQIPQLTKRINNNQSLNDMQKAQEIRKMQRIQSRLFKYMFENINAVQLQMIAVNVARHKGLLILTLMDMKVEERHENELLQCINGATKNQLIKHTLQQGTTVANTLSIISDRPRPLEYLDGSAIISQRYQISEVFYRIEDRLPELRIVYKNNNKNGPPLILTFRATADTDIPDINYHFLEIDLENSIVSGVMEEYQFAKPQQFKKALQDKINSLVSEIPTNYQGAPDYINNIPKKFIEFLHELITKSNNIKSDISISNYRLWIWRIENVIENDWLKIFLIGIIIIAVIVVAYRYFTKRSVQDEMNGDPQHNTDENIISNTDEGNNINNTDEGNNLIGAEAQ